MVCLQIICPAVDQIVDIGHQQTRQLVSTASMVRSPGKKPSLWWWSAVFHSHWICVLIQI